MDVIHEKFQENLKQKKPIVKVCDLVMLKAACSAPETRKNRDKLHVASLAIILSRKRITKALTRLHGCIFVVSIYSKVGFSHD